jgi:hypothetical protein
MALLLPIYLFEILDELYLNGIGTFGRIFDILGGRGVPRTILALTIPVRNTLIRSIELMLLSMVLAGLLLNRTNRITGPEDFVLTGICIGFSRLLASGVICVDHHD